MTKFSKQFNYQIVYIPRNRLNTFEDKIVLWVNPIWFDDKDLKKYLWLADLMEDRETYVTNVENFKYKNVESFFGKKLVVVRGYYYFGLEDYFKNDLISRVDVVSETTIPNMIRLGRAEFGVIGNSTLSYIFKTDPTYKDKVFVIDDYKKTFTRGILATKSSKSQYEDIKQVMSLASFQKEWKILLKKWHL